MNWMQRSIARVPGLRLLGKAVRQAILSTVRPFRGSEDYWRDRYEIGGDSGCGSYGELARFKADVINNFVGEHGVQTVIEYGCGDGNQLRFAVYPSYLGFDVSDRAVQLCRSRFRDDDTKAFKLLTEYCGESAELALSLDVIYHLVEETVFRAHMNRLFDSATQHVIIYSSNTDTQERFQGPHIRHRRFTEWVDDQRPDWMLLRSIPNRHPYEGNVCVGSSANFYIYQRTDLYGGHTPRSGL